MVCFWRYELVSCAMSDLAMTTCLWSAFGLLDYAALFPAVTISLLFCCDHIICYLHVQLFPWIPFSSWLSFTTVDFFFPAVYDCPLLVHIAGCPCHFLHWLARTYCECWAWKWLGTYCPVPPRNEDNSFIALNASTTTKKREIVLQ